MGAGAPHGRSWVAAQGWALAVEPQAWEAPVTGQRTSVGLDVHARSVVGRGLDERTGEVLAARLTPAHEDVIGWLRSLPGPVRATYEAGPTGFGLARALEAAGIDCVVAAPSRLLRPSGDRVKPTPKTRCTWPSCWR
jgi:transposase